MLGTYTFPSRTVRVLQTQDERIQWTCDCEKFRRQTAQREPLWCKHIAKAAARAVPSSASPAGSQSSAVPSGCRTPAPVYGAVSDTTLSR